MLGMREFYLMLKSEGKEGEVTKMNIHKFSQFLKRNIKCCLKKVLLVKEYTTKYKCKRRQWDEENKFYS